jgi:localization factor PodJL
MERRDYSRPMELDGRSSLSMGDGGPLPLDEQAEPRNPSLDEPWDRSAADALVRLYESGDARKALQSGLDYGLRERLSHLESARPATADPVAKSQGDTDRDWLETRLARITAEVQQALAAFDADHSVRALGHRFDQFEKRFEAAFANAATRTDVEGLKLVEAHVNELHERAAETKDQLSRLLVIEAHLAAMKTSISDERVSRLAAAVAPTGSELTRMAETAAEAAVRRLADRGIAHSGSRDATSDLLSDFIEERRRSEQQAAEALETMQQAMQHILDRIDSIEMTQAALLEDTNREPAGDDDELARINDRYDAVKLGVDRTAAVTRSREGSKRGGLAADTNENDAIDELTFAALGPGPLSSSEPPGAGDRDRRRNPSPMRNSDNLQARGRGARTPTGSGILLVAGLAAFLLAGYWLVSGISLQAPLRSEIQSAEIGTRPGHTDDVVPLKPSSDEVQLGSVRPEMSTGSALKSYRSQSGQADDSQGSSEAPARLDQTATTDGGGAFQTPIGMVIEQSPGVLSPQDIMRMRQRQRMATLSTRLGQQQALETGSATYGAKDASVQDREDTVGVVLEMPPLTIGPQSLRVAAAKGDASAQFDVAARFAEGKGVKQDFAQAAVWYQRAATQGLAAAQYRLAALYERGLGLPADAGRARTWYKRAAEQGNVKAMHNMAVLSVGRDNATSDYAAAAKWFTEAAEYGVTDSQYNLAVLLESGLGVPKDLSAAYRWYSLAARGGDKEAVRRRDRMKTMIDQAMVKAVETDIADWRPRASDALANDAHTAGEAWKTRASGTSG